MAQQEDLLKKIISHCKEYGFIFPSSDIYDGLAAVYDYGQNGVELKNNIKEYWWKFMTRLHENIVGTPKLGKPQDTFPLSTTRLSTTEIQKSVTALTI